MHTLISLGGLPAESLEPAAQTVSGGIFAAAPLLVGLPLASAAVLLLLGRRADRWGHWLGVLASAGAFVVGLLTFLRVVSRPAEDRVLDVHLGTWLDTGSLHVDAGLRLDPCR